MAHAEGHDGREKQADADGGEHRSLERSRLCLGHLDAESDEGEGDEAALEKLQRLPEPDEMLDGKMESAAGGSSSQSIESRLSKNAHEGAPVLAGFVMTFMGEEEADGEGGDVHGGEHINLHGGSFLTERESDERQAVVPAVVEHGGQLHGLPPRGIKAQQAAGDHAEHEHAGDDARGEGDDLEGLIVAEFGVDDPREDERWHHEVDVQLHQRLQMEVELPVHGPAKPHDHEDRQADVEEDVEDDAGGHGRGVHRGTVSGLQA